MDYPEYVKVYDKKYKINTDFRIAIECDSIARDNTIGDYERGLAVICVLFEEKAIDDAVKDVKIHAKLLELAKKYLACEKEDNNKNQDNEPNMNFEQDKGYIQSSFKYDYKYDPYELEYLHWYPFWNDLNNLSNSEFGNCCILNRIRNFRDLDLNQIKDPKEREKARQMKETISLKKNNQRQFTHEEINNINEFYNQIEGKD